jgi:sarcosine oxidase subunit alpha
MSRIKKHPILSFKKGREIHFIFDGHQIKAYQGETIVAALHAVGIRELSKSIDLHRPRGLFCSIGKCSSCLMLVNGVPNVKACVTAVEEGMIVESQGGKGMLDIQRIKTIPRKPPKIVNTELTIVGSGPAGLSAAKTSSKLGVPTLLVDENPKAGGQLVKQTHKFFGSKDQKAGVRGIDIADGLHEEIKASNSRVLTQAAVLGLYREDNGNFTVILKRDNQLIEVKTIAIIIATGAMEKMLAFPNNDLPGVYGAGAVQTLMNVYGVKPGERALMVGAGNVGLIVAYQLLQAGVAVEAVVEAMPKISGYHVHAAKLRRFGVPILTSHSIKKALGRTKVEGATIIKLDKNFKPVEDTEQDIDVDIVCLAVGLNPSTELARQAGCECHWIPELGGYVPIYNLNLRTTIKGIYVAGDSAGIGEASTAIIEGKIAALSALLGMGRKEVIQSRGKAFKELESLRAGPLGRVVREGKRKIFRIAEEVVN